MAFNEALATRIRALVAGEAGLTEKRMFGGLSFLINGNMSVGVHGEDMIVRIAPEGNDSALREPGVRPFDITGRPMRGWLYVTGSSVGDKRSLSKWVNRGVSFARSLPAK